MYFTQMFFIHQYYTCAASCYSSGSLPCPSLLTTKWWRRGDLDLGSTNSSWLCHVSTTKPTSPASSSLLRFCPKLATSPRAQGKACGSSRVQPVPFQQDRIMESQNGSGWKGPQGLTWCHLPAQPGPSQSTHRTAARQFWNISSKGDSTPSTVSNNSCTKYNTPLFWGHY